MWSKVILLLAFGIFSYQDVREKKINLFGLLGLGLTGVLLQLVFHEETLISILGGVMLGVVLLLLSGVGRIGVGIGDGCLLLVSGIFLGFWENLQLFMMALFLTGGVALFLVTIKRKGKYYRLPFVPFVLVAYLIGLI